MWRRGRSKWNAVPTWVDGIRFHSKKEAARYEELKLLEQAGKIRNLKRQRRYSLDVRGVHICEYRSDFEYEDMERGGVHIVEDVKGKRTQEYLIKRALMLAVKRIEIVET